MFRRQHIDSVPNIKANGTLRLVIAGADTTTITMRALFYYTLKHPRVWKKLVEEVRAVAPRDRPMPYQDARVLPYLDAVIQETVRYHPAVSMSMERIVPDTGLVLPDGSSVPPGSLVGMNPYIVGRNKDIFGADAEDFRPDRWLRTEDESDEQYKERMQRWGTAQIAFGGGSRICLGRNLSMMEVYKVVPTLISRYEIELDDPNETWWYSSRWFYRVKGVICKLAPRKD